jgi:hypothetical protein
MGQEQVRSQLLMLHNAIAGTSLTYEDVVKNRKIESDFSLLHKTELSGMVASGSRVSVEKYGTLGDKLDYGTAKCAQ